MPTVCEVNPGCERTLNDFERRIHELEQALRGQDGIFATLKAIEIKIAGFTASVRTAVAIGSAFGAVVGALASIAVAVLKK